MPTEPRINRIVITVLGLMLLIVAVQSLVQFDYKPEEKEPVVEVPCIGEPIKVDYAFTGGYLEPWACKEKCIAGTDHYVLYTNGKATQCGAYPGCSDLGEDTGVTCTPPLSAESAS